MYPSPNPMPARPSSSELPVGPRQRETASRFISTTNLCPITTRYRRCMYRTSLSQSWRIVPCRGAARGDGGGAQRAQIPSIPGCFSAELPVNMWLCIRPPVASRPAPEFLHPSTPDPHHLDKFHRSEDHLDACLLLLASLSSSPVMMLARNCARKQSASQTMWRSSGKAGYYTSYICQGIIFDSPRLGGTFKPWFAAMAVLFSPQSSAVVMSSWQMACSQLPIVKVYSSVSVSQTYDALVPRSFVICIWHWPS
ncbi:uncharacterized protein J3D65DRAFT_638047 [Phyllosticta citribraziliensis]|uniref:Uncharacterized protein n=1 Tax=Phyllosticta citribraziliensis TaxID=989973 RepID=A0ABR1L8L2_9PEZI